ncbi:MAG: VCBS repeat-containing protein [Saprospiraceae bacterium]|nr:VCBS repeat-containing protein [Saprospiraceae bacterium]
MLHIRLFINGSLLLMLAQSSFAQTFTDRTSLLYLPNSFSSNSSLAVVDVNNDGKDDIVRLEDGNTVNIEYQTASNQAFNHYNFGYYPSNAWALAAADVNNDGLCDLFFGGYYDGAKLLLANNNGYGFSSTNLPGGSYFAQGSNFADINNDGWLDIFSCHDDAASRIWGNNGSGSFSEAGQWINLATVPVSDNSGNYGSTWTDFDNDGDTDLYIAKCRGGATDPADPRRINQLFVNDGNEHYTQAAGAYGLKIGWQSWTSDFQDIDNDGDFDCFITNHDYNSQLLRNDGTGHFTDISTAAGFGNVNFSFYQGILRDFDNDGFMDVLTANPGRLYHNNGNGTFTQSLSMPYADMRSFAVGDLNHDGFLDIFAAYPCGIVSACGTPDKLWMNNGNANHFLAVQLQGTQSNRKGVGARVEIHGAWGKQVREIRAGESYGISNSLTAHFGLGLATQIDYLVVHWPSGVVDVVANPEADQFLNIVEGSTGYCGSLAVNATPYAINASPDAISTSFSIGCANGGLEAAFTLCNEGVSSLPVGLPIAFYHNDPLLPGASLLEVRYTPASVASQGCADFEFQLDASQLPGTGNHTVFMVLNDDGTSPLPLTAFPASLINECSFANNFSNASFNYSAPTLNLGADLNLCDLAVQLNAGSGFASYLWQNGSTDSVFTASQSGSYWVAATDECGVQQSDTVQVTLNFAPQFINLGDVDYACPGDTIWLGVPDDFSYDSVRWQPHGIVDCDTCLSTFAVIQQTTSFRLEARVGACFSSGNFGVYVNDAPTVSLLATNGNCGNAATISANPTGSGPFNYTWSGPNGAIAQNSASIYPQQSGDYSVTVSDMNGCQSTANASVQVGPIPQISGSLAPPTCATGADGGVALAISGGNAPFSFLWSNDATTQNLTNVAAGSYSVTLTDVNQCVAVATYSLQAPPPLLANNFTNGLFCAGETATVSVQAEGGTYPYAYEWSNGDDISVIYLQPAGSYTVTVTDAHLCTATATTVLSAPLAIQLGTEIMPIHCATGTPGHISLSVEGGVFPYSYQWSNGADANQITSSMPGNYSATVTDANGCTKVVEAVLGTSGGLSVAAAQTPITCHPSNGNGADGTISVTATGGFGSYAFVWENGDTSAVRTGLSTGTYAVTVMDDLGCDGTATVLLEQPTQLITLASFVYGSCANHAKGVAYAQASGGTQPYLFHWNNGQNDSLATNLAPGTYSVTATDTNGCTDSDAVEIPVLQNDTTFLSIELCQHEESPLTGIIYEDEGEFVEGMLLSNYLGCDSVIIGEVTVHPEILLVADNGPLPYGTVYHGVILTQDTQFVFYDTTEFGCLRTISENVLVYPSATHETASALGLLAYPNPFDDRLHLRFTLPRQMTVSIVLHDALGRQVKSLVAEQELSAGEHLMDWDGKDLPPGVYLLRVTADGLEAGRKLVKLGK